MYFERFDIAEAYWCFFADWHSAGRTERCHKTGRNIAAQLSRISFRPRPSLTTETLTENGREIYLALVEQYETEVAA